MKEAEATKRHLFKSLFKNASIGIALVNDEGTLDRVNQKLCALLGYSEKELRGAPFRDFTHPEDLDKDLGLFSSLLSGERDSYEIEKRYVRKDGTFFWGLLTVSVARQGDGSNIVMGMVQDIDAGKRAEAALRKSRERLIQHNAYKDRLFSVIAHDLRGPVANAARALEILEKNSASFPKEKTAAVMSHIRRDMSETSDLLDNLLMWAQAQFREVGCNPSPLALSEEVANVAGQLRRQAEAKNITLEVLVPAGMQVHADEQMLHIILRNLLSNAIKFSETGKTVRIDAIEEPPFTRVSVSDEGVGLSGENKAKLLGRNMEGFTSYGTRGEKGTGLGINLCMDYIERHGGSLVIDSEEGRGSRCSFSVPADKPALM